MLSAMCVQEILERQDEAFLRFFKHIASRPPKFRKINQFTSIVFKGVCNQGKRGVDVCRISENRIYFVKLNKTFKFSKSRNYEGIIRRVDLKRSNTNDYYIFITLSKEPEKYGKSHNGASVGLDFGLKTYLTLSDGTRYENPQFMKESQRELGKIRRNIDKCKKGSNNRERKCKELGRLWSDICNKRNDFQWKLAHKLCQKYDYIFVEDLDLKEMRIGLKQSTNRKLNDMSHCSFVTKLEHIASKYGVVVHKIDRYYPSSKTCTCGYVNKELKLTDRKWVCPQCGTIHDRDLLAANNILRRGIVELESGSKTSKLSAKRQSRYNPTITRITA